MVRFPSTVLAAPVPAKSARSHVFVLRLTAPSSPILSAPPSVLPTRTSSKLLEIPCSVPTVTLNPPVECTPIWLVKLSGRRVTELPLPSLPMLLKEIAPSAVRMMSESPASRVVFAAAMAPLPPLISVSVPSAPVRSIVLSPAPVPVNVTPVPLMISTSPSTVTLSTRSVAFAAPIWIAPVAVKPPSKTSSSAPPVPPVPPAP